MGSQNNNLFYLSNNQLDYTPANNFVESITTKGNINKFLSNPLIVSLTNKLLYRNTDKYIEKLSEI